MVKHAIFCMESDVAGTSTEAYRCFRREADILFRALDRSIREGRMSAEECRRVWDSFYGQDPEGYEVDWDEVEVLALSGDGVEDLRASRRFWHEAAGLGIDGVRFDEAGQTPTSGELFKVRGRDDFESLRDALQSRYRISCWNDVGYAGIQDPQKAVRGILRARGGENTERYGFTYPEYLVFCNRQPGLAEVYEGFLHEADVLLITLRRSINAGEISSEKARILWWEYEDVDPAIYHEWDIYERWREDVFLWRAEAHNVDPDSLRAERETDEAPKERFYLPEGVLSLGTIEFVDDSSAIGIPGVSITGTSNNKATLEVQGRDTLEKLRDLLSGRYRIVEKSSAAEYLALPGVREALVMRYEHHEAARRKDR